MNVVLRNEPAPYLGLRHSTDAQTAADEFENSHISDGCRAASRRGPD